MNLPHDPHKRNPRKQVVFHVHNVDQHQSFTEVESVFLTLCFLAKQLFVSTLFLFTKMLPPISQKYYSVHCQGKLSLDASDSIRIVFIYASGG